MKKSTKEKYVTQDLFKRELEKVHEGLRGCVTNEKFEKLVLEAMNHGQDIREMKSVVFEIRDEARRHAERMDAYAKDAQKVFDNDRIHDGYIRELMLKTDGHERRISALESK